MPELPEVETIRRQLHAKLSGIRIKDVQLLRSGREKPLGRRFVEKIKGKKIKGIERRAKLLIWKFSGGDALLTHLKMTGKLILVRREYAPQKHDRAIFEFQPSRNIKLVWSDVRQFGFMRYVTAQELEKILGAYGPEPLEISLPDLADRLKTPKTRKLKTALMDQTRIAGIGSIYADEACHRAGLRPLRRLGSLQEGERRKLARAIKEVLTASIKKRGTSSVDYVDARGEKGEFAEHLRVYGRAGIPCRRCGTPIRRTAVAQRGSYFCPKCQL